MLGVRLTWTGWVKTRKSGNSMPRSFACPAFRLLYNSTHNSLQHTHIYTAPADTVAYTSNVAPVTIFDRMTSASPRPYPIGPTEFYKLQCVFFLIFKNKVYNKSLPFIFRSNHSCSHLNAKQSCNLIWLRL